VLLHHGFETYASHFLLSFYKKHQINTKLPLLEQLGCSAGDREDRAFVVRNTSAVQVTITSG